ncbi:MAG: hypothetical protein ACKOTA_03750 [Solirubrobacterales bacterium]
MEIPKRADPAEPIQLDPREWSPTEEQRLPTRRHGEILPPGASRRGRWRTAATSIPAWLIFGLIWWRAIVDQPDQLAVGALIWAGCAVFTALVIAGWVAWNRGLAHRRERRYGGRSGAPAGDIDYASDALGRQVVVTDGARSARHLQADVRDGIKRIGVAGD